MENFIPKLETDKYIIGSFDVYLEKVKELIKNNYPKITDEEVEEILKKMPTTYRAAITDKNDNFVGFIGLYDVDAQNETASIRFQANDQLLTGDRKRILEEFKKYISDSINIHNIKRVSYTDPTNIIINEDNLIPTTSNIIIPNNFLEPGITEETLEEFSKDYSIPKLSIPFTIKSNDKAIGIIGLSNLIWTNKRANLNIFLDKRLGSDIVNELSNYIIDDYLNYVHSLNVHNVNLRVSASDKDKLEVLKNSSMNYYGFIPFGESNNDNIETGYLFQHIPEMEKQNGIYLPENISISKSQLNKDKELDKVIDLNNGYKLVSPKAFEEENIDVNKIIEEHLKAMQNRDRFTIPLGEDKYFIQRGNDRYGIEKAVKNYTYVILDDDNNYTGFINILRTNADNKNVEIELAVKPDLQGKGIAKTALNRFYEELFKTGVASITSSVFEFNNRSIALHEKVAELNGIRLESYYINGRLWDMNIYSKVNEELPRIHK